MTHVWLLQVTDDTIVPRIRCTLWSSLFAAFASGFLFLSAVAVAASDAATYLDRRLMYFELIALFGLCVMLWSSYSGVKTSDAGKLRCVCWGSSCCVSFHIIVLVLVLSPLAAISHADDRPCCEPCRVFCADYVPPLEEEPSARPDLAPTLEFTFRLTCHETHFGDSCELSCGEECDIEFTSFGFLLVLMIVQFGLCIGNVITAHYAHTLRKMAALDVQLAVPPPPDGNGPRGGSVLGNPARLSQGGDARFSAISAGGGQDPRIAREMLHGGIAGGYGYGDMGPGGPPVRSAARAEERDPYGPDANQLFMQAQRMSNAPMMPGDGFNDIPQQLQLELRRRLEEFKRDPSAHDLHFQATLEAGERRLVHVLCTELSLTSSSVGDGIARHVVASKSVEALGAGLRQSL